MTHIHIQKTIYQLHTDKLNTKSICSFNDLPHRNSS